MSGGARQRNKGANTESNSHAATHEGEKKSKSNKGGSSSSSSSQKTSSGAVWKLFTLLFYVGLIAVCACSGWVVYNLQDELAQIGSNLRHISQQKADLAETVSVLQKQAKGLENTVSRLEFISKDIQEKQQSQESSIRKSEKDLDQIGTILKKFQKEFSSDIQVVKEQRETDSIRFENTVKEKFTELNNSLNDGIKEVIEVHKTSQEEINILKDKLVSLAEFHSIQSELDNLKRATSELQTSVLSNGESVQWLMTNAQNLDSITANTNEIQLLRDEHGDLKRNVDAQLAVVEELKAKLSDSSEVQTLSGKLEQLASTFSEVKNQFEATKHDLLKEFDSNSDSLESKLKPIEHTVNVLNSQAAVQFEGLDTLKASMNEYSQRLGRAEEALAAVQQKSSGDTEATTDNLEEGLIRLSEEVATLKSTVADLPNEFTGVEKLQSQVTSVLEAHKDELGGLKQEYHQWRSSIEQNINNIGSSIQQLNADELNASVAKLETDLNMLRTAVDSLVAYSVKIETNQNELETLKDSLEVLKESTETMMVKLEQIQEAV
ncbi:cytoskeleton-associated protein 4 L homeolog [Xenopus laevis]|uniref:Cytoskeleton-associated protein 4 L homeolog n=1 Tax=Xenopus laevis TaxID=8355 RepID=Q566H9_XENLA|nr:cytoskeleton-associated protein 4 L homeolog [Xenopus laevis]AAH93539.1 MGC115278 protein [Xenopus laevis]